MLERAHDLGLLLQGRTPLIVLETWQEKEALQLIQRELPAFTRSLYRWSITDGLSAVGHGPEVVGVGKSLDPDEILQSIKDRHEGGVYVLCDFHPYLLDSPKRIRLIKDIALAKDQHKTLIFLSHRCSLPEEIHRYSAHAKLQLPNAQEIQQLIRVEARRWSAENGGGRIRTEAKALQLLTEQLVGLPADDVKRLAYQAIADDGAITEGDLSGLHQTKFAMLNINGPLQIEYDIETMTNVGGLENFKAWLQLRQKAFLAAADSAIDRPKGVLLLGVQGSGKSMAAKAVAGSWQLPLLRLDMGSLFNKFIGETEKNLRDALQMAEQMAPCVLWLDELEKAMASGNNEDSGLSKRLLGYFLTWMSEPRRSVFVVATSNDVSVLPPELIRKGRFDEIFFVDLPDDNVRKQIFKIHISKRGFSTEAVDLNVLSQLSEGYSGAEIEQAVVTAIYSLSEGDAASVLNTAVLVDAVVSTKPLSVVMAEAFGRLKTWAQGRTVPA